MDRPDAHCYYACSLRPVTGCQADGKQKAAPETTTAWNSGPPQEPRAGSVYSSHAANPSPDDQGCGDTLFSRISTKVTVEP